MRNCASGSLEIPGSRYRAPRNDVPTFRTPRPAGIQDTGQRACVIQVILCSRQPLSLPLQAWNLVMFVTAAAFRPCDNVNINHWRVP
jgi:hypothetical protein